MIFGDRQQLAIEVDHFEAPWTAIDPHEEAVWGAVTIWVAGQNLSEHRRHGTDRVRDDLHMPLLPLARWAMRAQAALRYEERSPLGAGSSPHEDLERWSDGWLPPTGVAEADWLDRRDAWWNSHFTGVATPNVVAPSVGIVRNDDRALISWRTPTLPRADRTFARSDGSEVVSWPVVLAALEEFIAAVRAWAPPDAALTEDVRDDFSPLEYYTGLQEHEIDGFGFRAEALSDPAADPLAQVVRDLTHRTATGPARESIVNGVRLADEPGGHGWWDLRQHLLPSHGASFETDGCEGARATRGILGLDGQPIDDVAALLRSLDIDVVSESPPADADRMVVAGTVDGRAVTMILRNARTAKRWSERFELARAFGHLLLDQVRGEAIGAASGPHSVASRRRRAGAFAAEILLPTTALEEASDGVLDGIVEEERFPNLLERFGVGATTAAYQLWNQGFLSSTEIREDLVASVQK